MEGRESCPTEYMYETSGNRFPLDMLGSLAFNKNQNPVKLQVGKRD